MGVLDLVPDLGSRDREVNSGPSGAGTEKPFQIPFS